MASFRKKHLSEDKKEKTQEKHRNMEGTWWQSAKLFVGLLLATVDCCLIATNLLYKPMLLIPLG